MRCAEIKNMCMAFLQMLDLMDDEGPVFDLEELKATVGIKINFIQYANLKTKVRKLESFYDNYGDLGTTKKICYHQSHTVCE